MKRIFSFVLAIAMIFSMSAFTINATPVETDYNDAASNLAALNILKGDGKGNMMLDQNVSRYQAALFFVQALTGKTEVAIWNADKTSSVFSDVKEYGSAIDYAYGVKLILGRGNGVYGPNDPITYQDMLVMAVRALGYETADMMYPYGYILAAQKLGLTDDVELVNYKANLNRGETAQIMWNMLNTEVAVIDPLTDKVLYPGETGLTDSITNTALTRKTLLEDSGLAGGKFTDYIVDFNEADVNDNEDFDTVTLKSGLILAAKDFDITADTPKVSYMGIPVDVYVDVDVTDTVNNFTQLAYDDGDAHIVFTTFATYTKVINLADGVIKYDANNACIYLDGTKFADNKYYADVFTFKNGVWTRINSDDTMTLLAKFAYTSKGYVNNANNTYCEISYRVTDKTMTFDGVKKTCIEILYTPYEFGRYNVHTINGVDYTVIGTADSETTNYAGEKSVFIERLAGFDKVINDTTKTVANKYESAASVKVIGEAVMAGDFVYYTHNSIDNILTIGMNCGDFKTGRLTSYSANKNTVKIDNVIYSIENLNSIEKLTTDFNYQDYIDALEVGKDNVKFITVNGNIVYMEITDIESANASTFDFAIVTTNTEIMIDLLDMTETKYENALVDGLYVDGDVVKVAMMDITTGEWVLASIKTYAEGWVDGDKDFQNEYDIATEVKYADLIGETYKNIQVIADFAGLIECGLVAVVEETNGIYTIANSGYTNAEGKSVSFFVYGNTEDGLLFSDNFAKTNAITADNDVDAARVTLDDESVIIVVGATGIGSRVGVQKAKNSVAVEGYFLAASADLIVFVTDDNTIDVTNWADAKAANSDENWYITTVTTGVEVEAGETENDPYVVTVSDVYDMKAMKVIKSIQMEVEDLDDVLSIESAGVVLFKSATGDISVIDKELAEIIVEVANDNEDKLEYTYTNAFNWIDADTVEVGDITKAEAVEVNATVITLDMTGLNPDEYDFSGVVSTKEWNDETDTDNDYNVGDVTVTYGEGEKTVWEYVLDMDLVTEITEPTEGVYNAYIADNTDAIYIPAADSDDYTKANEVDVNFYIAYAEEDGIVNVVIYKVLTLAED